MLPGSVSNGIWLPELLFVGCASRVFAELDCASTGQRRYRQSIAPEGGRVKHLIETIS